MTAATWETLPHGALANLSASTLLRLSGPDALRFLNGQITQDARQLRPGLALPSCVTNHKGGLEAFLHLALDPSGAFLLQASPLLRDSLPARLEKYLIADDCSLEDMAPATALVHVIGPLETTQGLLAPGESLAAHYRFGLPGTDVWTTPDRLPFWHQHFPLLSPEDTSTLEVLHGIPAWGHELTPGLLPPEAGLDRHAIDYHKGCYLGQEVISRLRSLGRVNRFLAHLLQSDGPPLLPGWSLFPVPSDAPPSPSPEAAPAPLGTLLRVAQHPATGQHHALAFLRRGSVGPLLAGPSPSHLPATLTIKKTLDDLPLQSSIPQRI